MVQIVELSHEEKVKMYMKFSKRELIEMLLENQKHLAYHIEKDRGYYSTPIFNHDNSGTNPDRFGGYTMTVNNPFYKKLEDNVV